ncbi:MAG: nuclear transport factor 2 family protein [bacterium]|nr:nuclear transport factor 2 family protein [bacterium]
MFLSQRSLIMVRGVLDAQVDAWNRGDLDGFMAGYWQSPELTFFSGESVISGWQAVYEYYQKRYQAENRAMGRLTFSEVEVNLLGLDSACVRGRWLVETRKESLGGLFTLIMKKLPEGWRIAHDHTSGSKH